MSVNILVLPGDGIGPEITAVTTKVLEHLGAQFHLDLVLEEHSVGLASLEWLLGKL